MYGSGMETDIDTENTEYTEMKMFLLSLSRGT